MVRSDTTALMEKWLWWPSQAPWWQVWHTKTIARKNHEGWDTFQPPRVPSGRKTLQKSQNRFALKPPLWQKNDLDDLPKPPGGKYGIPKRSPWKIRKVERLSNHLGYHGDAKIAKIIKLVLFDTTIMMGKCLGWPSQAPCWQVLYTKIIQDKSGRLRPLLTTLGTFGTIVPNCLEILQKSIDSKSDLLAEFYGPKCAATFFNFQVVFYYECIFGLRQVPRLPPNLATTPCKFSED